MPTYFFTATDSARTQITKLFDFVWPTAAAMWNLRWQVAGYARAVPGATVEQLRARFTEGADIHGANLKRACIVHTWDEQKEGFARILLVNTIAVYEGWIEEVLEALGKKNTKGLQKSLQFPDSAGGAPFGVSWGISAITSVESVPMKRSLYPALCRGRYYGLNKLNEMLLCYRFFKELRNCNMHGGGIADQRLIDAYDQFTLIATPSKLGVVEVPIHTVPTLGVRVKVSLRGVAGFSNIVLKIIATLDAELSRAKQAEELFIERWKRKYPDPRMLSSKSGRRRTQIRHLAEHAGFPVPTDLHAFGNWLSTLGLTQF